MVTRDGVSTGPNSDPWSGRSTRVWGELCLARFICSTHCCQHITCCGVKASARAVRLRPAPNVDITGSVPSHGISESSTSPLRSRAILFFAPTTAARPPLDQSGMVSPSQSPDSDPDVSDYGGGKDGWSDCEEPSYEFQSMAELFNASLFPALLRRACEASKLSPQSVPTPQPSSDQETNPLFAVPVDTHLHIPCPQLFFQNVQGQWESPAAQPSQSASERKMVDMPKAFGDLLEVPKVDESLAPLFSTASLPADVSDALKAEDKKSEMALCKAHLASAWAVKAVTATSFFARISITWLRQLQDRIPLEETRMHQDLTKIVATSEYMADASLYSAKHSAWAMASNVMARRLLWLKNWRPESKHKWRPATAPFKGGKLFGDALTPYLVENKQKQKVISRVAKRSTRRFIPYSRWQPFWAGTATESAQPYRPVTPKEERPLDRTGYRDRSRYQPQPKHSFHGRGGQSFCRGKLLGGKSPHWWQAHSLYSPVGKHDHRLLGVAYHKGRPVPGVQIHSIQSLCVLPSHEKPSKEGTHGGCYTASTSHQGDRGGSPKPGGAGILLNPVFVPKSSGGWRAILDLKGLNLHLHYKRFKMQTLHSILTSIRWGDLLTSIDLKEAYLHIPILPAHRRYLRFCYLNRHFQYRALPFGLSSAPRVFTKILAVLAAHLRLVPVRVQCYLDDILIQSPSVSAAHSDLTLTIQTLQVHSFLINFKKSQMNPSTRLLHLGAVIDMESCHVYLSEERRRSIRDLARKVRRDRTVALATLSQLLGKQISCIAIVPWARLHIRELQ
ncbi:exocyst complex component 3 isoform X1 [Crotalus tigris]|uniref:exocyst complex component 3 isoform X1 n=1 Tax=Crotalus tigris TaxID=88082 RepID=UPI00192F59A5|nr:exocyst complex component 3 isoform X1 [Crotalus tigris]XP_039211542.1 exocyst complex component 3 isoform X1 [Crotalus tigris]